MDLVGFYSSIRSRQLNEDYILILGLRLASIYGLHDQYQWFNVQQLGPFSRESQWGTFLYKGTKHVTQKYWQVKENDREINDTDVELITWKFNWYAAKM